MRKRVYQMNKIVIAPDSYKGTLSAVKICEIINEEIIKVFPECQVISVPIADGGEGTVDSFLMAVSGKKVYTEVAGPYFESINSYYGLIDDGKTAIIEMAAAAGLPMVNGRENPSKTTTYGVGELILHAANAGAKKIIIGLGGSCTNDGGCGLLAALGAKFLDRNNETFIPVGGTLEKIVSIDTSAMDETLHDIKIYAMCDVTNPLYGPKGAAYIFALQKGADEEMVRLLDKNLQVFGDLIEEIPGKEGITMLPGAGAAGGLGAGLNGLIDVPLVSGIDMILKTIKFDEIIENANLIITGEGQIDGQSLEGKVIYGVSKYAKNRNIPLCVISGQALDEQLSNYDNLGISGIFTINRKAVSFSVSKDYVEENLRHTVRNIMTFIRDIKNTNY